MIRHIIKQLLIPALLLGSACNSNQPKTEHGEHDTIQEHEEEGTVSLSAAQANAIRLQTGQLTEKNLESAIKVNGKLEVPAQNKAAITALYGGVLQSLQVHPGSEVRKGQVIGTVLNTELSGLQQQLISVNAQLQLAELDYQRQQELVNGNAAPLKNLQRAAAERSSLKAQQSALRQQLSAIGVDASALHNGNISPALTLRAPISGTISDIHAQIGSQVDRATPVATIVNNSQLHLDLFVYERDLPMIAKGQTIHFTLTNNPGKEYDAQIFSIGTAFADASKAVPVHAEVEGDKTGLIEGMNVTAVISIGTRTAPAIPDAAIVSSGGKDYIFIETAATEAAHDHAGHTHEAPERGTKERYFRKIQVVRGASDLGFTEIQAVSPIPEAAQIVFNGAFFLMAKTTNTGGHEH